jgi:S-formylglutathione hydrolase FrmB
VHFCEVPGGNYFWTDLHPLLRYESMLMNDLWTHVNTMYPTRKDKKWAIGGVSMGGFGALWLGLKYPDRFCSIFAHSSYIPMPEEVEEQQQLSIQKAQRMPTVSNWQHRSSSRLKADSAPEFRLWHGKYTAPL